ncbi:lanthionine synthetase [Seongchinamella sediminis]|uniref:Lanthionine synthetase n=1 Tax=Seongchinamella sediminis TaxID=2283635 RepID=A0A3L7DXK0_9GAMM|nr:lanthionine synthetase [Seongchinamella sediminis]
MSDPVPLFEPDRHRAVSATPWDETRARHEIQSLVDAVLSARSASGLWPGEEELPLSLYAGVAGIAWTLDTLYARGYLEQSLPELCATQLAATPERLNYDALFAEYGVPLSHSFYLGDTGVYLQVWKETGKPGLLDRLDELIAANIGHPWMENLWGAPSTMLVASHLYAASGEQRFADHVRRGAAYLWERLEPEPQSGCAMWHIELYGEQTWLTGAGHGYVGNVFPLLRSLELFDEEMRKQWLDSIASTVTRTAQREQGLANWPPSIGKARKGRDRNLVQQCHGSPGFVISLSALYGRGYEDVDQVLLEAGELTWKAGPLNKYPGLCHGTPGNGYALLKLYHLTQDARWLQRARQFAVSALEQRAEYAESRRASNSSLWDGDMGLALFLADCIDARADFPTLDYF